MLAEKAYRYKEMYKFLEDEYKRRNKDFNSEERDLLSIAYKNLINEQRSSMRKIMAYEAKEKKKEISQFLPYIIEYKEKVFNILKENCQRILKFIEEYLLKKAEDNEAKVFYIKMKGDYNKYIAEFAEGNLKKQTSDSALKAYEEAIEKSKNLDVLNPIRLGLLLNFSVFEYEILEDHKKAIEIAKKVIEEADKELPNIDKDDDEYGDIVNNYNLFKGNLEMWEDELEE